MPEVRHASMDETLAIQTPEHVALAFDVAGIGSRALAYSVDWLIRFVAGAVLTAVFWRSLELADYLPRGWFEYQLLLQIVSLLLLMWAYMPAFEAAWDGQTPGKRLTGLRVIKDDGTPITALDAVLRNVLRFVDWLPAGYALGLFIMFFNRQSKRIGDFAAGTLVVKEHAYTLDQYLARDRAAGHAPARRGATAQPAVLNPAQYEMLGRFLERRGDFDHNTRTALAAQLAQPFRARIDTRRMAAHQADDEALLEALLARGVTTGGATPRQGSRLTAPQSLDRFVETRRARWEQLAEQCHRIGRGNLRALGHRKLAALGRLYRQAAADHALAQTYYPGAAVAFYLNRLVASAHNVVYRRAGWSGYTLLDFYLVEVPATFRRYLRFFWLSAAMFFGPAVGAFGLTLLNQNYATIIIPPEIIDHVERGVMWTDGMWLYAPQQLVSLGIFVNNLFVTVQTFVGGLYAGLGTLYSLVMNGYMLGSIFALVLQHGMTRELLNFITPHGVIEISMILIGGMGGLILASCLLAPGRYTRRDAFRVHGRAAVRLMLAAVPVLLFAGWVEGNFSPSPAPFWLKQVFGVTLGVVLFTYLFGRSPRREEPWRAAAPAPIGGLAPSPPGSG